MKILVALCGELCDEFGIKTNEKSKYNRLAKESHALWEVIFGYEFAITYENRLFGFTFGEMLNPDDDNRNIAFKVETFLSFLCDFHKTLEDEFKNPEIAKTVMGKALLKAGEQCGSAFGKSLANSFKDKKYLVSDESKIMKWCEFDTRAGFGFMSYNEKEHKLTVTNLFLHAPHSSESYTEFFEGYAKGVLEELLKKQLKPLKKKINGNAIVYTIVFECEVQKK